MKYSSAELTAVDLVQFADHVGGYQRVATVLAELAESMQIEKMNDVLPFTSAATIQRLGYLLEYVLESYNKYMEFVVEKTPTYKQYVQNMELKMQDPEFLGDTDILLRNDAPRFEPVSAWHMVKQTFVDRMPGKRD